MRNRFANPNCAGKGSYESRIEATSSSAWSVSLVAIASASGQAEQKQQMAEDVFKNVQVLKGISVNEFMGTMGFFSASLGLNCVDCHISESSGDWARYADDSALKRTTRRMIPMVNNLNKSEPSGRRAVTCYTCHRDTGHPKGVPSLAEQYGTPPPDDPNEIEILGQAPATSSANLVLDKYLQAIGGAQSAGEASPVLSPKGLTRDMIQISRKSR